MTRAEHLQWCKDRALEYANANDLQQAFASMASDLRKHPETKSHPGIQLGIALLMNGHLDTKNKMIKYFEGFN